ncbi:MAG: hypothetical protein JNK12_10105 [Acidimicrobiales bacterium]|nr:hypothetical protein [Acidimicrobiales bacterium]
MRRLRRPVRGVLVVVLAVLFVGLVVVPPTARAQVSPGYANRVTRTIEDRCGRPVDDFPFPIMVTPPHTPHDPIGDFDRVDRDRTGSRTFWIPTVACTTGLFGRYWLTPRAPTSAARLVGVKFVGVSWTGAADNALVVFSLLDRTTEDNALGTVEGAAATMPGQLVGVLFERSTPQILMRLEAPVPEAERRFVAAVDTENLPTGKPTTYPTSITVDRIVWLWRV